MTPEEREQFYDREIAPVLMDLARRCEGAGLSFLALVEWSPDETGKTMSMREGSGIGTKMVLWAMQAKGNSDNLIWQMQRHGREHGHNSVCLSMLDHPVA